MTEISPAIVTTNLAPLQVDALRWSRDDYQDFVISSGYDSLELHPLRSRLTFLAATGRQSVDGLVSSFHQSFRGETAADMVRYALQNRTELKRTLPAFGALPHADTSLRQLSRIQADFVDLKPVVVFPERLDDQTRHRYGSKFSELLVQPKPKDMIHWPLKVDDQESLKHLTSYMLGNHFNICLDFNHWQESTDTGQQLPQSRQAFMALASSGLVREVHFGPNRTDLPNPDNGATLQALLDNDPSRTELGEKLVEFRDIYRTNGADLPPIVVEMTADQALAGLNPIYRSGKSDRRTDLIEIHRAVTYALHELAA